MYICHACKATDDLGQHTINDMDIDGDQQEKVDWSALALKKRHRKFRKSGWEYMRVLGKLWIPLGCTICYFIGIYFWAADIVIASRDNGHAVLQSEQRSVLNSAIVYHLHESIVSDNMTYVCSS